MYFDEQLPYVAEPVLEYERRYDGGERDMDAPSISVPSVSSESCTQVGDCSTVGEDRSDEMEEVLWQKKMQEAGDWWCRYERDVKSELKWIPHAM